MHITVVQKYNFQYVAVQNVACKISNIPYFCYEHCIHQGQSESNSPTPQPFVRSTMEICQAPPNPVKMGFSQSTILRSVCYFYHAFVMIKQVHAGTTFATISRLGYLTKLNHQYMWGYPFQNSDCLLGIDYRLPRVCYVVVPKFTGYYYSIPYAKCLLDVNFTILTSILSICFQFFVEGRRRNIHNVKHIKPLRT